MSLRAPHKFYISARLNDKLGYFVAYEKTSKGVEDKKTSANLWAKQHNRPSTINSDFANDKITGFKILKTVSRYSTSNKFYRVEDPRGFILEISAENLMDIVEQAGINKGVVSGKAYWAYDRNPYLMVEGMDNFESIYKNRVSIGSGKNFVKASALVAGRTYVKNTGEEIVYLGRFYSHYLDPYVKGQPLSKAEETVRVFLWLDKNSGLLHQQKTLKVLEKTSSVENIDVSDKNLGDLTFVRRTHRYKSVPLSKKELASRTYYYNSNRTHTTKAVPVFIITTHVKKFFDLEVDGSSVVSKSCNHKETADKIVCNIDGAKFREADKTWLSDLTNYKI